MQTPAARRSTGHAPGLWFLLGALLCVCVPGTRAASPRVQRQVGACTLEAPAAYARPLDALAVDAARLLPRLQEDLGVRPLATYRIVLIPPGQAQDEELRRLDASAPSWAAGFLFPARRQGGLRLARARTYPYDDLTSVLVHEATHMLLYDAAADRLPRWFGEGVATWEGRRWGLQDLFVYSAGLLTHRLPPLAELDDWFLQSPGRSRVAYAASFDFVNWTVRHHGPDVLGRVLKQMGGAARGPGLRPFPEAWKAATGSTLDAAEVRWRRGSLLRYRWIPALLGTTALWVAITLLALLAGVRRRARSLRILAQWDDEAAGRRGGGPPDPGLPPGGSGTIH